jgi:hypothetical protein
MPLSDSHKKRIVTALILLPLLALAISLRGWTEFALLAALSSAGLWEFYSMSWSGGRHVPLKVAGLGLGLLILYAGKIGQPWLILGALSPPSGVQPVVPVPLFRTQRRRERRVLLRPGLGAAHGPALPAGDAPVPHGFRAHGDHPGAAGDLRFGHGAFYTGSLLADPESGRASAPRRPGRAAWAA